MAQRTIRISFVRSVQAPIYSTSIAKSHADYSFDQIKRLFEKAVRIQKPKDKALMYLFARLKPWAQCVRRWDGQASRCTENIEAMTALVYDLDNKPGLPRVFPDQICDLLGCKGLFASSASNTPDIPRGRLVVPITRDITPEEYVRVQRHILGKLNQPALDRSASKPAQPYYLPVWSEGAQVTMYSAGVVLDIDKVIKQAPKPQPKTATAAPTCKLSLAQIKALGVLNNFSPDDDDDRWKVASALRNAFGDVAFPTFEEWYRPAKNFTGEKLYRHWQRGNDAPAIPLQFLLNRKEANDGFKRLQEQAKKAGMI